MIVSRSLRQLPQLVDGVLRQDAGEIVVVVEWVFLLPGGDLAVPLAQVGRRGCDHLVQLDQQSLDVADDRPCRHFLILLISDGSMSTWTILPCSANSATLPVTRSSKRTPKASNKSHRPPHSCRTRCRACRARRAKADHRPGNPPMPISVVVTGIPVLRTNSASSSLPPEAIDPAAGVDDRPPGVADQLGHRARSVRPARAGGDAIAGQIHRDIVVGNRLRDLHVLGNVDEHRTRPAGVAT